ncbi:MAG: recombinase family protein, partial [Candidatus Doudnabacteria bacterium]|nr:recombinase family protein [Candidatus Doudnabacteria bacterium]
KAEQGWFPSRSPLGYKSQGDSGHKIHVIDEATAPLIRKLFEMYSTGNYSIKYLTNFAYDEGLRSRKGNRIAKSLIAKLLSDPFYYGMFEYRKKLWPGKHEALISKELFDHVQEMATGKTTPKLTKHPYTFKGLAKCGVCGKTISWERQKGHIYGHCKNYGNCLQRTTIREERATDEVSKAFKELRLDNPRLLEWVKLALKEGNKEKAEYQAASIDQMNQRAEQLRHRLDRLYDDRLDDKILPEIYERKYQEITTELNSLTVSIKQHDTASEKYHDIGIQLLDIAQQAETRFTAAQPERQREIVNLVLESVVIDGNNVRYQYRKPFELLQEAVAITNSSKKLLGDTFGGNNLRTDKSVSRKGNAKILEKILAR